MSLFYDVQYVVGTVHVVERLYKGKELLYTLNCFEL